MRRIIWFGMGIAVTVVAAGYVARTHERFKAVTAVTTPAGIGDQIGQLAVAVRDVADEFRRSMSEHEHSLTQALLGDNPAKKTEIASSQPESVETEDGLDDLDHYL